MRYFVVLLCAIFFSTGLASNENARPKDHPVWQDACLAEPELAERSVVVWSERISESKAYIKFRRPDGGICSMDNTFFIPVGVEVRLETDFAGGNISWRIVPMSVTPSYKASW